MKFIRYGAIPLFLVLSFEPAVAGDLFDHYGIDVVEGAEKRVPCRSKGVILPIEELHTCISFKRGPTARKSADLETATHRRMNGELQRRGWVPCGGLGSVVYYYKPPGHDLMALEAWDENADYSDLKNREAIHPEIVNKRSLVYAFVLIEQNQIPFKTKKCPPY